MKREYVAEYATEYDTMFETMSENYSNVWLMDKLDLYLKYNSSILELGMGRGEDFEAISKKYFVTGTDNSPIFIESYKSKHPRANVFVMNSTNINTNKTFDCIYSNKVLQHLSRDEFELSLTSQLQALKKNGIIFMTLWYGVHREELMFDGNFRLTYYTEKDIIEIIKDNFNILSIELFSQVEEDDSMLVVLQRKANSVL